MGKVQENTNQKMRIIFIWFLALYKNTLKQTKNTNTQESMFLIGYISRVVHKMSQISEDLTWDFYCQDYNTFLVYFN